MVQRELTRFSSLTWLTPISFCRLAAPACQHSIRFSLALALDITGVLSHQLWQKFQDINRMSQSDLSPERDPRIHSLGEGFCF